MYRVAISPETRSKPKTMIIAEPGATLDSVREAKTMLEETAPTARRVLGSAHPLTGGIEETLRRSQAVLAFHDAAEEA